MDISFVGSLTVGRGFTARPRTALFQVHLGVNRINPGLDHIGNQIVFGIE